MTSDIVPARYWQLRVVNANKHHHLSLEVKQSASSVHQRLVEKVLRVVLLLLLKIVSAAATTAMDLLVLSIGAVITNTHTDFFHTLSHGCTFNGKEVVVTILKKSQQQLHTATLRRASLVDDGTKA